MKRTKVYFRVFPDGDVIALFPEIRYGGYIASYQHIGQHCNANPSLIRELRTATRQERSELKEELESIGYNLFVIDGGKP